MKSPPTTHERARNLRRSTTEPERALWALLRQQQTGHRFRRQHPIGAYVLDFYCPSLRLCIEVDGPAHLEAAQIEHDLKRDVWLSSQGVRVLRFTTADVQHRPAAIIARIVQAATPSAAKGGTSPTASP